ncbi:hypothetical protein HAU12_05540 [Weissella confusa]|nr:hypothetical protein [Weissella confusa]
MNREWVYLATVYDPEKRRVVSYGLSPEMTKEFATSAPPTCDIETATQVGPHVK